MTDTSPTDRQLTYAKDLGIEIPTGATRQDVSDLISVKIERDKPARTEHIQIARGYGLKITNHIGKRKLFSLVHETLCEKGREPQLIEWFVYRVARNLVKGSQESAVNTPSHPAVQAVTGKLADNKPVIDSIRRYSGESLIWFGEFTGDDGIIHSGGSKRTEAYKQANLLLQEILGMKKQPKPTKSTKPQATKGCLTVILGCISAPAILYFGIKLLTTTS